MTEFTVQTKSRPFDDLSDILTQAVGAVKGVGDEVRAVGRAQAERLIADLDLVDREDFDVLKAMFEAQQEELAALKKTVASLEKKVKSLKG